MIKKILVIHGPNLNLLGEREPGIYGSTGIDELNKNIIARAKEQGLECEIFQSNHEGAIIDKLHAARLKFDGVIINAGAYTHYSYAIRDAIAAIKIPCIEVHISNVFSRDEFRSKSVIAPVCKGSICGFGFGSYYLAVIAMSEM
ncbi:MAG: type II 3-dehydroquinate dehydratase [Ruminococcus sp.]|jgi:3-dehydroquinate dehydratase-2|nr:type II 3-dehydroquinate dehydratase [Ruminococcus sp.]MCI6889002.1 type II 3-dehydroquinate dehydratase [Ruminococcus sp.]MDD6634826.1 type II 3-dehydroquinate dehydratase [Ruminococcus sp.]MDY3843940.1 type II 3-dehydroquinate dehydratase [Ruminococcus sp.]CDF02344.1 3-dehydroquinate dehydratase [Ruminococcus sp. CAG:624]